jgi:hypothetical protein
MTYEDALVDLESTTNLDYIVSISLEAGIAFLRIGRQLRLAMTHIIEKHDAEVAFEVASHGLPHRLVAAEAMGEQDCPITGSGYVYIMPTQN